MAVSTPYPYPYHTINSIHRTLFKPSFLSYRSSVSDFRIRRFTQYQASSVKTFKKRELLKNPDRKNDIMTITPAIRIVDGKLMVKNRVLLSEVPNNVFTTSALSSSPVNGVFLGAEMDESNSRHVVDLGILRDTRFMASFRFKLWWMTQKMGNRGGEIPFETQFLLIELGNNSNETMDQMNYVVFLPLIDGAFRGSLQGRSDDDLVQLCIESGDVSTIDDLFTHVLFMTAGNDPFVVVAEAVAAVKAHLGTFRRRCEKKLPKVVDYFGWCTWDAFYQKVTQEGVEDGLRSLAGGGAPAKFVIIDDGWQSVGEDDGSNVVDDQKPLLRLTGIEENSKFQSEDRTAGIESIVEIAKEKYGLKYVYVWHALTGYWGGVRPGKYGSLMKYPAVSRGVLENDPGWKSDPLAVQGVGLIDPKNVYGFYNELHGYLGQAGVDGVKVDVQCILETLGGGLGGRVELTRQYHEALDASVARNFKGNGIIACMSHNIDALYCSKQTAVVRASDDFYPHDPVSHTIHVASVAFNSIFLGEFMLPDWDMFHSVHPAAEYHASARAISGGPIYVSDAPGKHNFKLLKKLVLPDGTVLRPRLPGRPTHDCLFSDPARDGISLLKIWNMNKYTGVLGVYNCQGSAWSTTERKNTFHETNLNSIMGTIRAKDVHLIADASVDPEWTGDCAIYCHRSKELLTLPHKATLPISLKILEHDIFTVTPVKVLAPGLSFAPLGLVDMYNGGGAIDGLRYDAKGEGSDCIGKVHMEVKGCGRFGAYSSVKPRGCTVDSTVAEFMYDSSSRLVTLYLENMPKEGQGGHIIEIEM